MPKILMLLVCCALFPFAAAAADDDMSLIDLFGEDAKKEEPAAEPIAEPEPPAEPQKAKEEEKVEVDDEGVFSFLNFSFLKKKEKAEEFAKKPEEPQETFLERMTRLGEEGNVDACLTLGYMYLYGENGVARDEQKAFRYYSMAASQGDKIAVNNLGSLYYSGIGTEKNVNKAVEMFDKAARLGNGEAAINLAFIYLTANAGASDKRIVELLQQAAETGNITAQFMMGYAYYRGYVVPKNFRQAFELIRQAAVSYDEAQYELAQRYINAEGTPRNYGNAVKYLTQAAHQGHIKSMTELGDILAAGTAYQKNEYQAYIWFNIASVYGAKGAAEKRDALEKKLEIEEVLQAQAAAETFAAKPTEMTLYIRQTFGQDLGSYIDKKMGRRAPVKRKKQAAPKKAEPDSSQPLKLL